MSDQTSLSLLRERIDDCRNAGLLPASREPAFQPFERLATAVIVPACCEVAAFLADIGVAAYVLTALDTDLPLVGIRVRSPEITLIFGPLASPDWIQISTAIRDKAGLQQTETRAIPMRVMSRQDVDAILVNRLHSMLGMYCWQS